MHNQFARGTARALQNSLWDGLVEKFRTICVSSDGKGSENIVHGFLHWTHPSTYSIGNEQLDSVKYLIEYNGSIEHMH